MKLCEGVLESLRSVQVDYDESTNTITVEVVERDMNIISRSRTIPVRTSFPFGRPLVDRIRRAVIECDHEIEASKQPGMPSKELVDAAYAALYYSPGGDGDQSGGQLPPLVRLSSGRRPAERGTKAGRLVRPPPLVGPPDTEPSE